MTTKQPRDSSSTQAFTSIPILKANGLSKAFGGVRAVDEMSFDMGKGELLALIGPNGAGKTTCFHLLHGHLKPDQGSVWLNNQDITSTSSIHRARMGLSRTFQVAAIYPALRVADHLHFATRSTKLQGLAWLGSVPSTPTGPALDWLRRLHLESLADRFAHELSYGDLKRLELAMVLAQKPSVLLMDEPTAGLPPKERQDLMRLVQKLAVEEQLAVLLTEHAMDVVFGFADRLIVMHRGRLIAQGSAEAIANNDLVREAYLGSLNLEAVLSTRSPKAKIDETFNIAFDR